MSAKLFYDITGVIPMHSVTLDSNAQITSDTPFVAVGMYVDSATTPNKAVLLCAVPGGRILSVRASEVKVNFSDEMKKALAEVVLTT